MSSLIVDTSGKPFGDVAGGGRVRAESGMGGSAGFARPPYANTFPYEAASLTSPEMGNWYPWIRSPDSEINLYRDQMVARSRDLARNDGWASGGVTRILDNTVGAHLRLSTSPDWRVLRRFAKGFDASWAKDFGQAVEALWRLYSEDLGRYNDVSRQLTVSQQLRLALRHKLVDGEALLVSYWKPERVGRGAAQYATSFLVVDPDIHQDGRPATAKVRSQGTATASARVTTSKMEALV